MKWAFDGTPVTDVAQWWDERPCNVKHSDFPVGTLAYSREVTYQKYRAEPHIPAFAKFWTWRNKLVLEIGCGIGSDTISFVREGANVYAFDVSKKSVDITLQRLEVEGLRNNVYVRTGNVEESLGNIVTPDLIYSFGVLHHTPHPDVALANLRHVANEETELRIMLYHRWSTKGLRLGLTDRAIARGSEARADTPVTYAFSRRRARRLLEQSGWEIKKMWVDHIFPYRVEDYRNHEWVLAFPWRFVPHALFQRISRLVGWHLLIVAKPKETDD